MREIAIPERSIQSSMKLGPHLLNLVLCSSKMFRRLGHDVSERSVFRTTYSRRQPADKGKRKEKAVAVSMTSSPARKIRNARYSPFLIYWVSAVK